MIPKIKILIVDDHNLIAEAWESILNAEDNFEVIGKATTEREAIEIALEESPDIVLMDINLAEGDGFSCTSQIYGQLPKTKILGLSFHDDLTLIKKLFSNGASGYLTKTSSFKELITAIDTINNGEEYICTEVKNKYFKQMMNDNDTSKELTNREIEIVKLIAAGLTSIVIGDQLNVSNRTIDTHRHNILKKINLHNSAQLGIWAKNKGYI